MNNIDNALNFLCPKLNDLNIDYYVVGAIGAYFNIGIKSSRFNDDLDILIEEKYIDLLKEIFNNSEYIFYDNRFTSDKILNDYNLTEGEHEVFAKQKNSDFHIGFFLFSKTIDSYTNIDYFRENNIQKKMERTLPIKYFNYQYSDEPIEYNGNTFKTVTVECIYKNKLATGREKDIYDCNIFKEYIDLDKLNHLKGMSNDRKVSVKSIY